MTSHYKLNINERTSTLYLSVYIQVSKNIPTKKWKKNFRLKMQYGDVMCTVVFNTSR